MRPEAYYLAGRIAALEPAEVVQVLDCARAIAARSDGAEALPPVLREAAVLLAARVQEALPADPPA